MEHYGFLMSGEVECDCGWKSGHFAVATDAVDAFDEHLDGVLE